MVEVIGVLQGGWTHPWMGDIGGTSGGTQLTLGMEVTSMTIHNHRCLMARAPTHHQAGCVGGCDAHHWICSSVIGNQRECVRRDRSRIKGHWSLNPVVWGLGWIYRSLRQLS